MTGMRGIHPKCSTAVHWRQSIFTRVHEDINAKKPWGDITRIRAYLTNGTIIIGIHFHRSNQSTGTSCDLSHDCWAVRSASERRSLQFAIPPQDCVRDLWGDGERDFDLLTLRVTVTNSLGPKDRGTGNLQRLMVE